MTEHLPAVPDAEVDQSLTLFHVGLSKYLTLLGLPTRDVLVSIRERLIVVQNLPTVVDQMSAAQREAASYLSKFTTAVSTGLFDAALNYLWDETIRNLRSKINQYDLQYFLDTAISDPATRIKFQTEADLQKIPDWELIRGCQEIGLISDLALKHLDFIRDMRNFASAAHPNQNQLTGLQLVQWMDTCIREVLTKDPSGPAIEAKRLLRNLRERELDASSAKPINQAIAALDSDLLAPLLRATFGMFVDPKLPARARENLRLVRRTIWRGCSDPIRYEIGLKNASFRAHGETDRAELAREFLEGVEGLTYLSESDLALEISSAIEGLMMAHNGWNNFYQEPAMVSALAKLVPESGNVPDSVRVRYVKSITLCKLTNGNGVAIGAESKYDRLIRTWQDKDILTFLSVLQDAEIRSRLQFRLCSIKLHEVVETLKSRTSNALALDALKFIANYKPDAAGNSVSDSRFSSIVKRIKEIL